MNPSSQLDGDKLKINTRLSQHYISVGMLDKLDIHISERNGAFDNTFNSFKLNKLASEGFLDVPHKSSSATRKKKKNGNDKSASSRISPEFGLLNDPIASNSQTQHTDFLADALNNTKHSFEPDDPKLPSVLLKSIILDPLPYETEKRMIHGKIHSIPRRTRLKSFDMSPIYSAPLGAIDKIDSRVFARHISTSLEKILLALNSVENFSLDEFDDTHKHRNKQVARNVISPQSIATDFSVIELENTGKFEGESSADSVGLNSSTNFEDRISFNEKNKKSGLKGNLTESPIKLTMKHEEIKLECAKLRKKLSKLIELIDKMANSKKNNFKSLPAQFLLTELNNIELMANSLNIEQLSKEAISADNSISNLKISKENTLTKAIDLKSKTKNVKHYYGMSPENESQKANEVKEIDVLSSYSPQYSQPKNAADRVTLRLAAVRKGFNPFPLSPSNNFPLLAFKQEDSFDNVSIKTNLKIEAPRRSLNSDARASNGITSPTSLNSTSQENHSLHIQSVTTSSTANFFQPTNNYNTSSNIASKSLASLSPSSPNPLQLFDHPVLIRRAASKIKPPLLLPVSLPPLSDPTVLSAFMVFQLTIQKAKELVAWAANHHSHPDTHDRDLEKSHSKDKSKSPKRKNEFIAPSLKASHEEMSKIEMESEEAAKQEKVRTAEEAHAMKLAADYNEELRKEEEKYAIAAAVHENLASIETDTDPMLDEADPQLSPKSMKMRKNLMAGVKAKEAAQQVIEDLRAIKLKERLKYLRQIPLRHVKIRHFNGQSESLKLVDVASLRNKCCGMGLVKSADDLVVLHQLKQMEISYEEHRIRVLKKRKGLVKEIQIINEEVIDPETQEIRIKQSEKIVLRRPQTQELLRDYVKENIQADTTKGWKPEWRYRRILDSALEREARMIKIRLKKFQAYQNMRRSTSSSSLKKNSSYFFKNLMIAQVRLTQINLMRKALSTNVQPENLSDVEEELLTPVETLAKNKKTILKKTHENCGNEIEKIYPQGVLMRLQKRFSNASSTIYNDLSIGLSTRVSEGSSEKNTFKRFSMANGVAPGINRSKILSRQQRIRTSKYPLNAHVNLPLTLKHDKKEENPTKSIFDKAHNIISQSRQHADDAANQIESKESKIREQTSRKEVVNNYAFVDNETKAIFDEIRSRELLKLIMVWGYAAKVHLKYGEDHDDFHKMMAVADQQRLAVEQEQKLAALREHMETLKSIGLMFGVMRTIRMGWKQQFKDGRASQLIKIVLKCGTEKMRIKMQIMKMLTKCRLIQRCWRRYRNIRNLNILIMMRQWRSIEYRLRVKQLVIDLFPESNESLSSSTKDNNNSNIKENSSSSSGQIKKNNNGYAPTDLEKSASACQIVLRQMFPSYIVASKLYNASTSLRRQYSRELTSYQIEIGKHRKSTKTLVDYLLLVGLTMEGAMQSEALRAYPQPKPPNPELINLSVRQLEGMVITSLKRENDEEAIRRTQMSISEILKSIDGESDENDSKSKLTIQRTHNLPHDIEIPFTEAHLPLASPGDLGNSGIFNFQKQCLYNYHLPLPTYNPFKQNLVASNGDAYPMFYSRAHLITCVSSPRARKIYLGNEGVIKGLGINLQKKKNISIQNSSAVQSPTHRNSILMPIQITFEEKNTNKDKNNHNSPSIRSESPSGVKSSVGKEWGMMKTVK